MSYETSDHLAMYLFTLCLYDERLLRDSMTKAINIAKPLVNSIY